MEQFNPGLLKLVALGNSYVKAFQGMCVCVLEGGMNVCYLTCMCVCVFIKPSSENTCVYVPGACVISRGVNNAHVYWP